VHVLDRHTEMISLPPIGVSSSPINPLQHAVEALHDPGRAVDVRFPSHHTLVHTA